MNGEHKEEGGDGDRVVTKRVLTDATREDIRNSNSRPPATYIPSDLGVALQNVGSRVRRSVSAGYKTHRFLSPPASFSSSKAGDLIFRSDVDTLNHVYSNSRRELGRFCDPPLHSLPRSVSSPFPDDTKKRMREDKENGGSAEGDADAESTDAVPPLPAARPIRPLRAPLGGPRGFTKTRSLPANAFSAVARDSSPDFDDMEFDLQPSAPDDYQAVGFSDFCHRDPD